MKEVTTIVTSFYYAVILYWKDSFSPDVIKYRVPLMLSVSLMYMRSKTLIKTGFLRVQIFCLRKYA